MLSLSSLIEFLMDMLRDDATQADFARDPSGTLAARGLSGVTAEDVRDVQPMLADVGGVRPLAHESAAHPVAHHATHHAAHHDVVRAIHDVSHSYEVVRPVTNVMQEYKTYNSYAEFHTDNSMHVGDGSTVTIGVNNQGGVIDHSNVGGHDLTGVGNTTENTENVNSNNDDHSQTENGSHNHTDEQNWDDVGNHGGDHGGGHGHHPPAEQPVHHPIASPVDQPVHHPIVHEPVVVDDPEPVHDAPVDTPPHSGGGTEGMYDSYSSQEPAASADYDHHSAVPLGSEHV